MAPLKTLLSGRWGGGLLHPVEQRGLNRTPGCTGGTLSVQGGFLPALLLCCFIATFPVGLTAPCPHPGGEGSASPPLPLFPRCPERDSAGKQEAGDSVQRLLLKHASTRRECRGGGGAGLGLGHAPPSPPFWSPGTCIFLLPFPFQWWASARPLNSPFALSRSECASPPLPLADPGLRKLQTPSRRKERVR